VLSECDSCVLFGSWLVLIVDCSMFVKGQSCLVNCLVLIHFHTLHSVWMFSSLLLLWETLRLGIILGAKKTLHIENGSGDSIMDWLILLCVCVWALSILFSSLVVVVGWSYSPFCWYDVCSVSLCFVFVSSVLWLNVLHSSSFNYLEQ